jgi:hypothetical protein
MGLNHRRADLLTRKRFLNRRLQLNLADACGQVKRQFGVSRAFFIMLCWFHSPDGEPGVRSTPSGNPQASMGRSEMTGRMGGSAFSFRRVQTNHRADQ